MRWLSCKDMIELRTTAALKTRRKGFDKEDLSLKSATCQHNVIISLFFHILFFTSSEKKTAISVSEQYD